MDVRLVCTGGTAVAGELDLVGAVEERDAQHADQVQPQHDQQHAGKLLDRWHVVLDEEAGYSRRRAQRDEDDREADHERDRMPERQTASLAAARGFAGDAGSETLDKFFRGG